MALSLKNTFLEFQGLNDFGVPSAGRRSASASASVSSGACASNASVMRVQLERLSQAIQPAAPLLAHPEAPNTTVAVLMPLKQVDLAGRTSEAKPSAAAPPKKPTAPRLQLPLSSRLKLSALANIGMRQMQQRMEETTSAPALADRSPTAHARWADEPSDDESSGSASTRVPGDSDEGTAIKRPAIKKGKSKDHRDEQVQHWQDCAAWNHWAFQGQWAPGYDGAWEAQQPSWRW